MGTRRAVLALAVAAVLAGCSGDDDGTPADGGDAAATQASPSLEPTTPGAAPSPTASDPPTGSAVGELAEGFPSSVIQVPPGAEVEVSTAAPTGDGRLQVSLVGRTGEPAEAVLQFYRDTLVPQGFVESPAAGQPAGVVGGVFSRGEGAEILTLAVTTVEDAQSFSIGGMAAGG